MELFTFIANKCTTKQKKTDEVLYMLNYIYLKDKSLIKTLENIQTKLNGGDCLLVIEGLRLYLLKHHKNSMYNYFTHLKVRRFMNK